MSSRRSWNLSLFRVGLGVLGIYAVLHVCHEKRLTPLTFVALEA